MEIGDVDAKEAQANCLECKARSYPQGYGQEKKTRGSDREGAQAYRGSDQAKSVQFGIVARYPRLAHIFEILQTPVLP
jgi:hypothetical protein